MANLRSSEKISSDVVVVGLHKKNGKTVIATSATSLDTKKLQQYVDDIGASAKPDDVSKIAFGSPKVIITTGLGEKDLTPETLRRAAGAAARALAGTTSADFALPTKNSQEFAAVAEGAALGAYSFTEFRGSTLKDQKLPLEKITIISKIANKAALTRAEVIARHTHLVRDLVNTPPSHLTPDSFAQEMKKLATSLKLKSEILNHTQLKTKGYGGITGVGQGSANPPRMLHVSYSPSKPKARIALVGKGITFDSGGLALKPALGMEEMKSDMSGAAAVIATIFAAAQLKLPIAIEAYACMAENMPSDTATRPSDVITIYGGKTVEVLNPDAEGRLVMADGLVRAQEDAKKLGLDALIDVATLTGAQGIALGTRTSGVMTNNPALSEKFMKATESSGELFWPMPLPEELRPSLDSPIADIANIGDRQGGMLVAGLFLREFVDPSQPWLHLDIAFPAFNPKAAHGYTSVGGTGVALRSLIALMESF